MFTWLYKQGAMLLNQETLRFIFGLKLRSLRQEKQFSLKELSKRSGLSPSYLNEIEKGKKYPKNDKIMILADSLEVTYDDLISVKLKKELSNLTKILEHNLLLGLPFDVFGVPAQTLFEIMAERPVQFSGLVGTILELARKYDLSVEGFFYAALRAYLDMNSNYFADLESLAHEFRREVDGILGSEDLKKYLGMNAKYEIFETDFSTYEKKAGDLYYCFYSGKKNFLHLNKNLTENEKTFILLKEVAYYKLKIKERKLTSSSVSLDSYSMLFHNFQAAYFAGAYLYPEEQMIQQTRSFFSKKTFDRRDFEDWVLSYSGTVESFFHRLTQILPQFFNIDRLFYLNFDYDPALGKFSIDKELHLQQLHAPHKAINQEHYCQRWISTNLLKQNFKAGKAILAGAQISKFKASEEQYLVLSVTRAKELQPQKQSAASIGILLTKEAREKIKFLEAVPAMQVGHTCERCAIEDCLERRAPNVVFTNMQSQQNRHEMVEDVYRQLEATH